MFSRVNESGSADVTDAGLRHLARMPQLRQLEVDGCAITDAGLEGLADLPKLTSLIVKNTKVTAAGVKKLAAALPRCKIEWDGGVIEPKISTDPDRKAVEWVLSIGGAIKIKENGEERAIKAVGELPRGAFELTVVSLNQNPKVSDAGLALFKHCKNLAYLGLDGTRVGDEGLKTLPRYPQLQVLWLDNTPITDAGLVQLLPLTKLRTLYLPGTNTAGPGLGELRALPNLTSLSLKGVKLSRDSLKHVAQLEQLESLGDPRLIVACARER